MISSFRSKRDLGCLGQIKRGSVLVLFLGLMTLLSPLSLAKIRKYELRVENNPVNLSGLKKVDFSLTVNGSIPAPTLEFDEGDDAEITVHNGLKDHHEDVSIHWHGLLLPPSEDGVPYVNAPPIFPGQSRVFKFKIRQAGTYWYHSHTMLQEQKGVYGAIVIRPAIETHPTNEDRVLVLSDWSDENADQILKNLKKDGDYYLYKKKTVRSYVEAISRGRFLDFLLNEWSGMGGMDVSDVGYDAFLINGKRDQQLIELTPHQSVRLRIINAASSTYFRIGLGGQDIKVVSADGRAIRPIWTKEILMGMAETYDVIFQPTSSGNFEFKATAQDGSGSASAWIGKGDRVRATVLAPPDLYARMDHSHSQVHSIMSMESLKPAEIHSHSGHFLGSGTGPGEAQKGVDLLSVDQIQSEDEMKVRVPDQEIKLILNGDMRRYVWHLNGKTLFQDRLITLHKGNLVRVTFQNESMMHHPMHLHGHFFRVITHAKEKSPWKHTVDVPPMSSRVIEFLADEEGQWMLHCHNLYHMDSGMGRVVKYSSFLESEELKQVSKLDHHLSDPVYFRSLVELSSNHLRGELRASQTWNELQLRAEAANIRGRNFSYLVQDWDFEGDLLAKRWLGSKLNLSGGAAVYGERFRAALGLGGILPFVIESQVLVHHDGTLRVDLERRFQWTSWLLSDLDFSWRPGTTGGAHSVEVEFSLMWAPRWSFAAGLMLTNDSLGAGVEFQF